MPIDIGVMALQACLFMAQCALVGGTVLSMLGFSTIREEDGLNRYLTLFFVITIGLACNCLALFALAAAHAWYGAAILAYGALSALAAVGILVFKRSAMPVHKSWTRWDVIALSALLFATLLAAHHAPGYWDDTMYHLPIAASYIEHRGLHVSEFLRFPLFPQNIELLISVGLLFGGDYGAQVYSTLPMFLIALGLLGASQWLTGSILVGVLASMTTYWIQPVAKTLGYAYIDTGMALFCWATTLAVALWLSRQSEAESNSRSDAWLLIAGLMAGAAAGTKYFGLIFAVIPGAYLFLFRRNLKAAALFSCAFLVTGLWWYLRNYLACGNPVHPVAGNIFGYYLWDARDWAGQVQEQSTHGVPPVLRNLVAALRAAGALPVGLGFSSLLLFKAPLPIRWMRMAFISYFAFWFYATQVDRYLIPACIIGAFLAWYVPYQALHWLALRLRLHIHFRTRTKLISDAFACVSLAALAVFEFWTAQMSAVAWEQMLESRAGYRLLTHANTQTARYGDRLVNVGFENGVYFFHGTMIGDWFGPGRYWQMLSCDVKACGVVAPEQMLAIMKKFDARMLAISTQNFTRFDERAYLRYFDVLMMDHKGGYLLVPKDS